MTSFQSELAAFVASAPAAWGGDEARSIVHGAWLDTFAVAIAGSAEPVSQRVLRHVENAGRAEVGARPWLSSMRCTFEGAALASATLAHAIDYDDVTPAWRGHPSAVMFPALTSLAAQCGGTLEQVVHAYVIGFEVGAQVGQRLAGRHYETGWHATSTIGVLAATAAGCRLLRLCAGKTVHALGLGVAQAAGVQANFGTDAKPLQAGFAAAAAVRACLLAQGGVTASASSLDGPRGFADLYADPPGPIAAQAPIGAEPSALARFGLEFKAYPICYAAHRAIDAALALRGGHAIDCAAVDAIEIEGTPGAHTPLLARLPANAQEARFSAEFGVACALLNGEVGLRSFGDATTRRDDVRALMARSRVYEVEAARTPRRATVRIRWRDGRTDERSSQEASSTLDATAAMRKLADCLSSVGVGDRAVALRGLFDASPDRPIADVLASPLLVDLRRHLESRQWPQCKHVGAARSSSNG